MILKLLFKQFVRFRNFRLASLNELWQVVFWATVLNAGFGLLFYAAEKGAQDISVVDALWWSMVTMTTVGYGDYYAQTTIGRFVVSYPCMILGIGLIGYLVGYIANLIIDISAKKRRGLMDIGDRNHVILCGFPGEDKVLSIVEELRAVERLAKRQYVLVTEVLEELPEAIRKADIKFVRGAPTDEDILIRAGVLDCEGVVVMAQDPTDSSSDDRTFTVSSLIELLEKEHHRPIKTIAEVVSQKSIRTLSRAKVDGITSEEGVASCLLAQEFVNPGINSVISQLLTNRVGSQLYIVPAKRNGLRIRDLQVAALEHEINVQILGLIQKGRNILNPPKETIVTKDDRLIVLADREQDVRTLENEIIENGKPSLS